MKYDEKHEKLYHTLTRVDICFFLIFPPVPETFLIDRTSAPKFQREKSLSFKQRDKIRRNRAPKI